MIITGIADSLSIIRIMTDISRKAYLVRFVCTLNEENFNENNWRLLIIRKLNIKIMESKVILFVKYPEFSNVSGFTATNAMPDINIAVAVVGNPEKYFSSWDRLNLANLIAEKIIKRTGEKSSNLSVNVAACIENSGLSTWND